MIKNKNAEEESNKPPPPDPSVFRGKSGTDCQCSSVVECGENDRFLLLTADGDGRVKLWNGETKRNVWTVSDDDDDDDDENTTNDPKRKVSSILAIEIVEDCKESDRYKFLTHERDGTVCLWVSTPTENEEKEEDIFPLLNGGDETDAEASVRNRERMSHVLSNVKRDNNSVVVRRGKET